MKDRRCLDQLAIPRDSRSGQAMVIPSLRNDLLLLFVNVHYIGIIASIVIIAAVALDCFINSRKDLAWSRDT